MLSYLQKLKEKKNWRLWYKNIQQGYRNRIWHRQMYTAYDQKFEKINDGKNRNTKPRKKQIARKEGKLQLLWNIGSGNQQRSGN